MWPEKSMIVCSDNCRKLNNIIRFLLSSKVSIPLLNKEGGSMCQNNFEMIMLLANNLINNTVFSNEPSIGSINILPVRN